MNQNPFLAAVDILEERGWHQGRRESFDGELCVLGAMGVAQGKEYPKYSAWEHLSKTIAGLGYIGPHDGRFPINVSLWNDAPERSYEDVRLALKHAAHDWEPDTEDHPRFVDGLKYTAA